MIVDPHITHTDSDMYPTKKKKGTSRKFQPQTSSAHLKRFPRMLWWNRSNHDTFNLLESIIFFYLSWASLLYLLILSSPCLIWQFIWWIQFLLSCVFALFSPFLFCLPSSVCSEVLCHFCLLQRQKLILWLLLLIYIIMIMIIITLQMSRNLQTSCAVTSLQKQSSSHTWRQSSGHHQSNPRLTDTWTHTFRLVDTKQAQQGWEAQAGMGNSVSGLFPYHP